MAKDKVDIPSIQIGGNKMGQAFGGVIYSADSQIGYNGDPTKLNVNVALDTKLSAANADKRNFDISKRDLNLASPVDIKFAGAPMFRNMFLTSYNTSTTVQNKLLNLTYSDGAVLLDRIFVGLIHEHFHIGSHNEREGENGEGPIKRKKFEVPHLIQMTVECPKPEPHVIEQGNGAFVVLNTCSATEKVKSERKTLRYLANPTGIPGKNYLLKRQDDGDEKGIWAGGYIVLGKEEFTNASCDLSDVSYSFADLISSMRAFKINVDLSRYPDRRDNQHFTRNYSGTLKDVLQNWGNDLGISFYWDFTRQRPTLSVVDLSDRSIQAKFETAIAGIDKLDKGHGMTMNEGTDIIINEKNHSNSLDGTFSQAFSSTFNRGPSAKNKNTRKTTNAFFSCQKLGALAGGGTKILNRKAYGDFFISMTLGKYAPNLRDAFNVRCAINAYSRGGWALASGYFNALGFSDIVPITFDHPGGELITKMRTHGFKAKIIAASNMTQMISSHTANYKTESQGVAPISEDGGNYEMFIGVYDENLKEYVNNVEQEIANEYYGRNYVLSMPAAEFFQCNKLYKILENVSTKPNAEFYGANQHYKVPMAKFVQKIQDLAINSLEDSGIVYKNHLLDDIGRMRRGLVKGGPCDGNIFTARRQYGFFHFERQAPWMGSKEDVDNLLNPYTLQAKNPVHWADPGYYNSKDQPRVQKDIVKQYMPFMQPMIPMQQLLGDMDALVDPGFSKAFQIMSSHQSSGREVMTCLAATNAGGGFSPRRIGDIRILKGRGENILEELHALSSICDRSAEVTPKDTEQCTTVCEQDLAESLCHSSLFGQNMLSCGEMEAIKDSAYSTELMTDGNRGKRITGQKVTLKRRNFKESSTSEIFYADTERGSKRNDLATLTAPSENDHKGVLIYTRDVTYTDFGIRKVFDGLDSKIVPVSPQVSTIKYQVQDITQDVNTVFSEDNQAKILKGEIPVDILADMTGEVTEDGDLSYLTLQAQAASKYHALLRNNISSAQVDTPREEINYKIYLDGSQGMKGLVDYLRQENGLNSVTITSDESGYYLNVSFSNRPPVMPALDAIYRKVGPISKAVGPKASYLRSLT